MGRNIVALAVALLLTPGPAGAEPGEARSAAPARPIDGSTASTPRKGVTREALVRLALERSPAIAAAAARARALRKQGDAEALLAPPMAEVQLWQIPFAEPHRLDRAGMTMIGLRQDFSPAREARARAARLDASVEEAVGAQQAWALAREVEHAFVDYAAAIEVANMHVHHGDATDRVAAFARARYEAGGALADIAQAERESAMITAELAAARSRIDAARARINGLLVRPHDAPLGPPVSDPPERTRAEVRDLLRRAERFRPELQVARRKQEAAHAMAEADRTMTAVPMLGVGAYYFPPSESMSNHAFGLSFTSTLPWLWGDLRTRSQAADLRERAASQEHASTRAQVALEVMTAAAEVVVAATELETLERQVLPSSQRAEQATLAGYEAGRADMLAFLMARTAVRASEVNIVLARAALAHAVTELRWATGRAPDQAPPSRGETNDAP